MPQSVGERENCSGDYCQGPWWPHGQFESVDSYDYWGSYTMWFGCGLCNSQIAVTRENKAGQCPNAECSRSRQYQSVWGDADNEDWLNELQRARTVLGFEWTRDEFNSLLEVATRDDDDENRQFNRDWEARMGIAPDDVTWT